MAKVTFSVLDYFVFISTLVFSALIGAFFWLRDRKKQSNRDYLTGGRNLSLFPVTMSLAASFMSTNTLLGTPAEIYLLGTQFTLGVLMFTIAVICAAEIFMPIYYDLELTSVNKYLLRRFNANAVRIAGSVGFILCTVPYLGTVLYGPALALSSVTELSITTSILVVGIVCTFYTSVGGIKAVIWSDVFQCLLMILGILMVVVLGVKENGFVEPFRIAKEEGRLVLFNTSPGVYRSDTVWAVGFGILVGWTGTYCVKQTQVQRYCCMASKTEAKKAIYWSIPSVISISLLSIWCGIILIAKYRGCDPISMGIIERYDQLMPHYVMESLSSYPGLPGLFVACVFSGSLSTLSSGFNALATVTWDDFIKRFFKTQSEQCTVVLNKIVAASYGIFAIAIAFVIGRLGTVLQASIATSGAITGPLLGLFCLGIFCPCVNAKGAFSGIVSGVLVALTIAIGSVVHKKPDIHLPLRTNSCSTDVIEIYGVHPPKPYILPDEFTPEGMNKVYHISYFFVPVSGLVTCLIIGVLVSIITGRNKKLDKSYISPIVLRFIGKKNKDSDEVEKEELKDLNVIKSDDPIQKMMNPVITEVKRRLENKQQSDNPLQKTPENERKRNFPYNSSNGDDDYSPPRSPIRKTENKHQTSNPLKRAPENGRKMSFENNFQNGHQKLSISQSTYV